MNKIRISTQNCEDDPTIKSIKPGTIFHMPKGHNPEAWYIKTDSPSCGWVRLVDGVRFSGQGDSKATVLIGSICIEPE